MRVRIGGEGAAGGLLDSPAVWGAGLALRRAGEAASGAAAEPRGEKGRMGSRAVLGWPQVGGAGRAPGHGAAAAHGRCLRALHSPVEHAGHSAAGQEVRSGVSGHRELIG